MNRYRSKTSLFLLELIINILFFFILLSISFQFLTKTYRTARQASELTSAVSICENIASVYQNANGQLQSLKDVYPNLEEKAEQFILYFDENEKICSKQQAYFSIVVIQPGAQNHLQEAQIQCKNQSGEEIYQFTVCTYNQRLLEEGEIQNE